MQTVTKFMKQTSSFHTRKVKQAQVLKNILIKKRQACFKLADIWTLLKKMSEKTTTISKENLETLYHLYILHCWPPTRRCIRWVALNTVLYVLLFAIFCKYDLFFIILAHIKSALHCVTILSTSKLIHGHTPVLILCQITSDCPSTVNTYIIQSHTLTNVDSLQLSMIILILNSPEHSFKFREVFINRKYC